MMKFFSLSLLIAGFSLIGLSSKAQSVSLFNGSDLKGWHMDVPAFDKKNDVQAPFIIRNGLLVSLGTPNGHLITDKEYSNYRLKVKYRFSAKPGNCGVLVHVSTPRVLYSMFPKSLEVQMEHTNAGDFWCIAEDISVHDMETRRGPKADWGTTEKYLRRIKNLTDGTENALGEWNTMIIECYKDIVRVTLNNKLVNYGFNCTAQSGQIAIQAEGSEVEFKKIDLTAIKRLKKK
jgi:hypothetical protein